MERKKSTTTAEFSAQYKDPRWQKKRLEVMERDGFRCRKCLTNEEQLHVHHLKYTRGAYVWEYPDSNLVTLCESCHEEFHVMKDRLAEFIDPLLESWITRESSREFDAEDLWHFLVSIHFTKKEHRRKYFEVFRKILSLDFLTQNDGGDS